MTPTATSIRTRSEGGKGNRKEKGKEKRTRIDQGKGADKVPNASQEERTEQKDRRTATRERAKGGGSGNTEDINY